MGLTLSITWRLSAGRCPESGEMCLCPSSIFSEELRIGVLGGEVSLSQLSWMSCTMSRTEPCSAPRLGHPCAHREAGMETPRSRFFATSGGNFVSTFALCFSGQALWPAEADSSRQDPGQIPAPPGSTAPPARATSAADPGAVPAGPAAHCEPRGAEPHTGAGGWVLQARRRRGEAAERPGEKSQENRELGRSGFQPQLCLGRVGGLMCISSLSWLHPLAPVF